MIQKVVFTIVLYFCMFYAFIFRLYLKLFPKKKRNSELKNILFLENQPPIHAGSHYRVEILKEIFKNQGVEITVFYPFNNTEFKQKPTFKSLRIHLLKKMSYVLLAPNYDVVVVRRELLHMFQYGGLFLEKLLLALNNRVVLDMDDYMPDLRIHLQNKKKTFYNRINFHNSLKNSDSFFLFNYYTLAIEEFREALLKDNPKLNKENLYIFPMSIDYSNELKLYKDKNKIVGWLSQSHHFKRIDEITPYLNEVFEEVYFELHIVADKPYKNENLNVPVVNKTWSLEKEKEYMQAFDIGIAPINSRADLKERKGTFKLVQYMALGVVSVTSYMTYSEKLIKEGESGFLVHTNEEWTTKLKHVLSLDCSEMSKISRLAYDSFYNKHHIESQAAPLLNFYRKVFSSQ